MYRYIEKKTYWLLLLLMISPAQSCRCADVGLEIKAVQSLADTCESDEYDTDLVLFTQDELQQEEELVKEQELNRPWYAIAIEKLQHIAGRLSSPIFSVWYKFFVKR